MKKMLSTIFAVLVLSSGAAVACEDCDGLGADAEPRLDHVHVAHETTGSSDGIILPLVVALIIAAAVMN